DRLASGGCQLDERYRSVSCALHLHLIRFFFSSRRRHTRCYRDWSSDVCSSDLVTGTIFGALTLTWVVSGWLSMEPFFWASGGRETGNRIPQTLSGGPLDAASFPMVEAGSWYRVLAARSAKEIEFVRIQGEPFFIARGVERDPVLISANPFEIRRTPFSVESLVNRLRQASPNVAILESQLLS